MIIEKTYDDNFPVTPPETTGVKHIDPVKAISSLPDSGKDLPSKENKPDISNENIEDAVQQINKYIQTTQNELQFSIDDSSGKTVVKVIDSETKELIRQIPGEEALNVAQKLREGANLEIFKSYS